MSKRNLKRFRNQDTELTTPRFIVRCLLLVGFFFLVYILSSLVASAFMYNTYNPTQNIYIFALICCALSSFSAGFILSKINGQKYLLGGIILCALITGFLLLISIFVQSETENFVHFIVIPAFCLLGSFLGKKRIRNNYKRKKHR
ncbi:MAG: TIGR04086 family membrane protein [Clostridia bacterium]|nr:TIGR04086 family membrane protein [Clostridia bacterium]